MWAFANVVVKHENAWVCLCFAQWLSEAALLNVLESAMNQEY